MSYEHPLTPPDEVGPTFLSLVDRVLTSARDPICLGRKEKLEYVPPLYSSLDSRALVVIQIFYPLCDCPSPRNKRQATLNRSQNGYTSIVFKICTWLCKPPFPTLSGVIQQLPQLLMILGIPKKFVFTPCQVSVKKPGFLPIEVYLDLTLANVAF